MSYRLPLAASLILIAAAATPGYAADPSAKIKVKNKAPVAKTDVTITSEDTAITVNALANDTDTDGDRLTITKVTAGKHVTASLTPDGRIRIVPAADWSGRTAVKYIISDGKGGTDTGTVQVFVRAVNDAPVVTAPTQVAAPIGSTVAVTGVSVADPDSQRLITTITVTGGTATLPVTKGLRRLSGPGWTGTSIVFYGDIANTKAALAALKFTATAATGTLSISSWDGRLTSSAAITTTEPGLVARWTFDAPAVGADSSGRNHLLSLVGAQAIPIAGGNALALDGNSYAITPHQADLDIGGTFTLSAWLRPQTGLATSALPYPYVFNKQDWNANTGWYLGVLDPNTDHLGIRLLGGASLANRTEVVAATPDAGRWIHLAVTGDGSTATLYRDGAAVGQAPIGATTAANARDLIVGYGFSGLLDDLRIYRSTLTPSAIASIAAARPGDPALVAVAGIDQSVTLPAAATLSGSLSGSAAASATTTWSQVSGPATADIATPDQLSTSVLLPQPGTYVFALTATSAGKSVTDQVQVTALEASAIDQSLVARWTFDEADGTVAADTTTEHPGDIVGGSHVAGRFGGALQLDGSSYVVVADAEDLRLQSHTIAAWVKADVSFGQMTADYPYLVAKFNWMANTGYYFGVVSPDSDFFGAMLLNDDSQAYVRTQSYGEPTAGRWMHLAMTFDGSAMRFYRDGIEQTSTAFDDTEINHDATPLIIGNGFQGALDDLRIFDRALDIDEVQALATQAPGNNG